jgi:uncharacterized protein YukE
MARTGSIGAEGPQPPTPSTADSPKQMASAAADTVKQEAAQFAAAAQDKAQEKIEQHKQTATQALSDFANAIRSAGDQLSQTDQSMAGRMVKQAADGLEGISRSVADKPPEKLLQAVRDFGRQNPTTFVAGSVLAGIALGRFLRASDKPRPDDVVDSHGPGALSAVSGEPALAPESEA